MSLTLDYYVYCWENLTSGKRYIGKGRGRRAVEHLQSRGQSVIAKALRLHGLEGFRLTFPAEGLTEAEAFEMERHFISAWGTRAPRGYNLTAGGEGQSGVKQSAETIAKRVAKLRGKVRPPAAVEASRAAHLGRKVDEAGRARMSAGQKRRAPPPPTHRARVSAALKGRPRPAGSGVKPKLTPLHVGAAEMLISLGAQVKDCASWFGVTRQTLRIARSR